MIIALTMNPSLDISYPLNQLNINGVNRIDNVKKTAGGKGLNVARVISMSKYPVLATGLLGGNIGAYIKAELDKDNILHDFTPIAQESRNCIAILHEGQQTEILESGPMISEQEQKSFIEHFADLVNKAEVMTISGSLPKGIDSNYYSVLIEVANKKDKKVILDCSGMALLNVLKGEHLPYLIKPNHEELSFIVGKEIKSGDINIIVKELKTNPLLNKVPVIVVSLGKNGAFVKYFDKLFKLTIPTIKVENPVGSGDSTIAGLAVGIAQNDEFDVILKRAMVFGMLNAMEKQTGCIDLKNYDPLFNQVNVIPYE